jgi:hypothetical protein
MTDFFDNFNFDPVSTTVKSTSYTIPAGQYARVTVTDFTQDVRIDSALVTAKGSYSGSGNFTNNTNDILIGSLYNLASNTNVLCPQGRVTNHFYNNHSQSIASPGTMAITLNPGDSISTNGNIDYTLCTLSPHRFREFWLPEGTLFQAAIFTVELYNKQGN